MAMSTWSYDDVSLEGHRRVDLVTVLGTVASVVCMVIAPLSAAAWALVRFWPLSLPVWVVGAVGFYGLIIVTAREDQASA